MTLDSGGIRGLHTFTDKTIDFDRASGIKNVTVRVGKNTIIDLGSTPDGQLVTIDTRSQEQVSGQCLVKHSMVYVCDETNHCVVILLVLRLLTFTVPFFFERNIPMS